MANSHVRIMTNFSYKNAVRLRNDFGRLFLSSNSQHNLKFRHAFSGTKKSIDYHFFLIINKSVCVSIRYGASWL